MSLTNNRLKRNVTDSSRKFVKRQRVINISPKMSSVESTGEGNGIQTPTKSPNDKREYRIIQLENGLRAVLISDVALIKTDEEYDDVEGVLSEIDSIPSVSPSASGESGDSAGEESDEDDLEDDIDDELEDDRSITTELNSAKQGEKLAAAGLCIGMGSFSDPDDIPGLAHFLEHMVFMGSKKYPNENSFDAFIKRHGGTDNAETDCERTIFYFEVHSKHFHQALDRFAQFFVSPLLNADSMEREMEAVDSEFQLSLPSDTYRTQQLFGSLAKDGQPMKKFMWGNLDTLKTRPLENNTDLHARLKDFYHNYYSAQFMTLAIQSRETLDTLESWVREIFSEIPNNNRPAPDFSSFTEPFDSPAFYKLYKIIPVKNIHLVELTWALPSLIKYYRVKPHNYLSWLIGHEGKGSVLSYLKSKIWALSLFCGNAGTGFELNSTYASFSITIDLTEQGLTHLFDVITVVFQYIEMLRRIGPQERVYREIQTIESNDFRWQEELSSADYVQTLCENMQLYPDEDLITGDQLMFEFDGQLIESIQNLLVPEKCNIIVMSRRFEKENAPKMCEPWYQTQYFVNEIDPEWMWNWKNLELNSAIHLPEVNKFIADNFEIKNADLPSTDYPVKILDNNQNEQWYKKDDKFNVPKAYIYFHFITPLINCSPQNAVLLDLFVSILTQNLSEAVYPAEVAQLSYTIRGDDTGLIIEAHGFNDKLPILFETFLEYIDNFTVTEELFQACKNHLLKAYYNHFIKPSKLCTDIRLSILQLTHWTSVDKRACVSDITSEMLLSFVNKFKSQLFIKGLVQGNMTSEEVLQMVSMVQSKLRCGIIPRHLLPEVRIMQLNSGEKFCRVGGFNTEDGNSVVTNYYQYEPGSIQSSCLLELLLALMEEPCFDVLRTQQQLGYDVYCMFRNTFGILGFSVTVHTQATKFTCSQIDERIEAFLKNFFTVLEKEITEEEFQTQVTSLIRLKRCVDLHLHDESSRNWLEIISGNYVFDRKDLEIEHLSKITLADLQNWCRKNFGSEDKLKKLSVQVVGAGKIHEGSTKSSRRRKSLRTLNHCSDKPARTFSRKDLDKGYLMAQNSVDSETSNRSDEEEFKIHYANISENDPLFISDIHSFKKELMIYPITKITK